MKQQVKDFFKTHKALLIGMGVNLLICAGVIINIFFMVRTNNSLTEKGIADKARIYDSLIANQKAFIVTGLAPIEGIRNDNKIIKVKQAEMEKRQKDFYEFAYKKLNVKYNESSKVITTAPVLQSDSILSKNLSRKISN